MKAIFLSSLSRAARPLPLDPRHFSAIATTTTTAASSSTHPRSHPSYPHTQYAVSPRLPGGLAVMLDSVVDRASGSWVFTDSGRRYLDFSCGIGVTNLGHCHPVVDEAVQHQVAKGAHLQLNCYASRPALDLAERFAQILPAGFDADYQVLFSNSGAEAIENAIKIARLFTRRQTVIVFSGGFHGRTIAAGALTCAKYIYRAGFQPTMSGVHVAPFPYCYQCSIAQTYCNNNNDVGSSERFYTTQNCCNDPIRQLRLLLKQQTSADEVAAILVEPLQGEGGYIVPPPSFLPTLRKIADEIGCLLLADEVQTGYGRTGKMFAVEHFNVVPDIIIAAKGIANGYPLSAMIAPARIMSAAKTGAIGGTFGGNAVSCAAGLAVIEAFKREKILENVVARGDQFDKGLRKLSQTYPIGDVRGLGLMRAIEFDQARVQAGAAGQVARNAVKEGLILLTAGVNESMRLIPPLNVNEAEIDEGLQRLERALAHTFTSAAS